MSCCSKSRACDLLPGLRCLLKTSWISWMKAAPLELLSMYGCLGENLAGHCNMNKSVLDLAGSRCFCACGDVRYIFESWIRQKIFTEACDQTFDQERTRSGIWTSLGILIQSRANVWPAKGIEVRMGCSRIVKMVMSSLTLMNASMLCILDIGFLCVSDLLSITSQHLLNSLIPTQQSWTVTA